MKALSIRQPWAGLIACGRKTVETRTWQTTYRGPLLIVSGLERAPEWGRYQFEVPGDLGGQGVALAIANLVGISAMSEEHEKAAFVKARPGLWAWRFDIIRKIRPFPVKGKLGLFDWMGWRSCSCAGSCEGQERLGERWLCASKYPSAINDEANLPRGKTCADCYHFKRCEMLFGCGAKNTRCDWNPSRFAVAVEAP